MDHLELVWNAGNAGKLFAIYCVSLPLQSSQFCSSSPLLTLTLVVLVPYAGLHSGESTLLQLIERVDDLAEGSTFFYFSPNEVAFVSISQSTRYNIDHTLDGDVLLLYSL